MSETISKFWTLAEIEARLEEAAKTLVALKLTIRDIPSRQLVRWPEVVRGALDAYGFTPQRPRVAAPSPAAIDRADETVAWLLWMSAEERRIVWARACKIAWRKLEDLDGRSHTTLRKVRVAGLDAILARLNAPLSKEDAVRLAFQKGGGAKETRAAR
ncbi:MAG: DUF6362 family protein [Alphaproteobacteria bacterium]